MRVSVVGGGAWGTALAAHLQRAGHDVGMWVRTANAVKDLAQGRSAHLVGVTLPPLAASTALRTAAESEVVVVAVPSEFCRGIYRELASVLNEGAVVVSATKGLELTSLRRMTEVAKEELSGRSVAALSGPSFALEVAEGQPTTVVVASDQPGVAEAVQKVVSTRAFRAYASADVIGVELGGALKNVIAIAAGIVDGLGYGHNTAAALITRGLAEMSRLAVALGGRPDTLAGLAGLGDLVLTCTGQLSRNRRVGQALGRGLSLEAALRETHAAVEGVRTTRAACDLAARAGIEMPIAAQMQAVLYEGKKAAEAVDELMLRSLKRE